MGDMVVGEGSFSVRAERERLGLRAAPTSTQGATASTSATGPRVTQDVDITLTSVPAQPKVGNNTFEATVTGADGKPITDAEVTAMFYMAAVPAMKQPEMKNTVALKHEKEGRYAGTGQVVMAGKWDVTVTVKRAGKEIGSRKFPIAAQ